MTTVDRRGFTTGAVAVTIVTLLGRPAGAQGAAAVATVRDGGFTLPVGMGSASRSVDEVRAVLAGAGLPTDTIQSHLNVTLIRRGGEAILIDCGAGKNFLPGAGELVAELDKAGVKPDDVKHVLFTHGHPDHLWGALDDFDTPLFPNAAYHMAEAEWDYWFGPDIFRSLPEDRHSFAAGAQRVLKILEPVLKRFRPGQEPVPGVLAVDARGHTPGHVAFEVVAEGGPVLIAGDVATHHVISFQHPDWGGAFDADRDVAIAARKALLDRAAADRLRLVGYHLPNGGMGRVERAGTAFRFVQ